ncbi:MAG: DUF6089 family protein [Bacteroidales bacterium]|nr:DUF6089 family protein [Bacteroidales bacterium]HOK98040.1 DUF6089 family protein [Bacteroidales bacterium]HPO64453.1 DUF6089 family protein [Bacteroidales bacterium]
MKKVVVLLAFQCVTLFLLSQSKVDLGLAVGGGYYMGDINPTVPFYAPGIDLGIVFRHNLNMRHVIKFEANYVRLRANDADFSDDYQQRRNASFATPAFDFALQFEFNFLPLKFAPRKISFSPFVSSGLALDFATRSQVKSLMLSWPFAVGVRTTIGKYWSMGVQWNYRKLFNDRLDGVENEVPANMKSIWHNNDWISFANVFVTYKVFTTKQECPAYKKE